MHYGFPAHFRPRVAELVYLDSATMPAQNNAAWGQRSNRGLIIGIFGLCLGLFGVVCGMFWEDIFNWIKHKVSQVHSCTQFSPNLSRVQAAGTKVPPRS